MLGDYSIPLKFIIALQRLLMLNL